VFYRIQGLSPHDRISGDVPLFTRQLALVTCDLLSSTLQFVFYATQIMRHGDKLQGVGHWLVGSPLAYMLFGFSVIQRLSPNFAALQKQQRKLEGAYRHVQTRLTTHAEAVALFGGEEFERTELTASFRSLATHVERQIRGTWSFDVVKDFIVKYCQSTMALAIIVGRYNNVIHTSSHFPLLILPPPRSTCPVLQAPSSAAAAAVLRSPAPPHKTPRCSSTCDTSETWWCTSSMRWGRSVGARARVCSARARVCAVRACSSRCFVSARVFNEFFAFFACTVRAHWGGRWRVCCTHSPAWAGWWTAWAA
jgi:hypothetical protein